MPQPAYVLGKQVMAVEGDLIQAAMGPEADQAEDALNATPRYSNSHGLPADLLSGQGPSMRDRALSDAKGRAARFRHACLAQGLLQMRKMFLDLHSLLKASTQHRLRADGIHRILSLRACSIHFEYIQNCKALCDET